MVEVDYQIVPQLNGVNIRGSVPQEVVGPGASRFFSLFAPYVPPEDMSHHPETAEKAKALVRKTYGLGPEDV